MTGVVCDRLATCPFYNEVLPEMPNMADRLMARYCHDAWSQCARKRAADILGAERVPVDLFPNDQTRLIRILKE